MCDRLNCYCQYVRKYRPSGMDWALWYAELYGPLTFYGG